MKSARMLGNYVEKLAKDNNLTDQDLNSILGCDAFQTKSFLKGRFFVPFEQISNLAKALGVSVSELLAGDPESYNATVVHCMNPFKDVENRETILDIIDNFIDIKNATM